MEVTYFRMPYLLVMDTQVGVRRSQSRGTDGRTDGRAEYVRIPVAAKRAVTTLARRVAQLNGQEQEICRRQQRCVHL